MGNFIETGKVLSLIDYLLYLFLIGVTGWTVYQIIKVPVKESIRYSRFRVKNSYQKVNRTEVPLSERSRFYRHIYLLLQSVYSSKNKTASLSIFNFLFLSISIGTITLFFMLVKFHDAFLGALFALVVATLPYLGLLVRLRNMRNAVGSNITEIVEILIHSYSAFSHDMYQSLKHTYSNVEEPELRKVLARLISDLQVSRNEEDLRKSIDLFIYTCGSSWAMRLGNIILKSYLHQENVLGALLQLQNQMVNNEKMLEQEKVESYDAFNNAILILFLFPVSLIGGKLVTRPQSWVNIQFGEKVPLLIFILTLVSTIIAILAGFLIRKPKNDL